MKQSKKILAILPHSIGGRLTTSSIIDGFRALSFKVDIFDELYDSDFLKKFETEKYSYLLGYDYSAINLKAENALDIKTINYFSDILFDPHSGKNWESLYPRLKDLDNLSFYWDEELTRKENNSQIHYLPHFVNTDIYKNTGVKSEYDVIFMGRLDNDLRLKTLIQIIKNFPKTAYFAIERHLEDAVSRVNDKDGKFLKNAYGGFIDNEKDMADTINKAKIVINFNEQGMGSLNYRTIQTMACERLLLGDFREEGLKFFGENYIYYEDVEDLIKKIDFYLKNEEIAKKIAKNTRKIIEEQFSHRAGVQKILDIMEVENF